TLTYGVTGFVNGDTAVTAVTGAPGEATTALAGSPVGTYPITLTAGTLAAANYSFALANGTLTVTAAPLTATANNASRVYGAANPTFTGTLLGAVNGDSLTETFATTATATSVPGTYAIVPGSAGANVANYTVNGTNGTLTISKATAGILLSTTATSGFNGSTSITLTATVSSPTSGTPTGTVTFYSGATAVGTGTIAAGVATFTTTALPVGSDSMTAVYAGDANFAGATSSSILITIAAGFGVTPTATALAFPSAGYQQAQTFLTINPGGQSYTLTFSCNGLPAKLSCGFSPATLPLSGVSTPQTVQMLVSNSSATASVRESGRGIELAGISLAGLLLIGLRRRRLVRLMLVAVVALVGMAAMSGCGTSPAALQQGAGTYNFNVVVSSGSTTVQTIPFTLTVPQ
ncbi:MAG: MBG domain-containing protein, partial [Acidobacteriota bacterium]